MPSGGRVRTKTAIMIDNKEVVITGRLLRTARLRAEYYEFVTEPGAFIEKLKTGKTKIDLFTFLQGIHDRTPRYGFSLAWDSLAVLPITTYEQWWKKQINDKTRNMVRRAQKSGVELRLAAYDDSFAWGIMEIYNETPIRQGKPFKHYGKDFETIKREHATFIERSDFIGAFVGNEMIGFAKVVHGSNASSLMQIISKVGFRDKAPTNALIAKAVELCAQRNIPHLHYGIWSKRGLGDFKKHHGFMQVDIPRYFVPLNLKGRLMLDLNLHRKPADFLPEPLLDKIVAWRNRWNALKYKPSKS
jgi:hypothetical protein